MLCLYIWKKIHDGFLENFLETSGCVIDYSSTKTINAASLATFSLSCNIIATWTAQEWRFMYSERDMEISADTVDKNLLIQVTMNSLLDRSFYQVVCYEPSVIYFNIEVDSGLLQSYEGIDFRTELSIFDMIYNYFGRKIKVKLPVEANLHFGELASLPEMGVSSFLVESDIIRTLGNMGISTLPSDEVVITVYEMDCS